MALIIHHSLINLILRIKDKGSILHHLLIQRKSRHEQELAIFFRILGDLRRHGIALLLKDDVVIGADGRLVFADAEGGGAGQGIGEGVPADGKGLGDLAPGGDCDVEDPDGGIGEFLDAVRTVGLARDDLDGHFPVVDLDGRDLGRAEVAVARLATFQFLRQVDPELHADVGAAVGVLARHLGVHDAPARGHELQVARLYGALVAGEIFVIDGAFE